MSKYVAKVMLTENQDNPCTWKRLSPKDRMLCPNNYCIPINFNDIEFRQYRLVGFFLYAGIFVIDAFIWVSKPAFYYIGRVYRTLLDQVGIVTSQVS